MRNLIIGSLVVGALVGAKLGKEMFIRAKFSRGLEQIQNHLQDFDTLMEVLGRELGADVDGFLWPEDDMGWPEGQWAGQGFTQPGPDDDEFGLDDCFG